MQGEEGMGKCSRCGTESDTRFCPNCGMSMGQDTSISGLVVQEDYPNKEPAIPQKKKSKRKLIIGLIAGFVCILIIAFGAYYGYVFEQEAREEEYISNLFDYATEVSTGLSDAEAQCNLVVAVWNDAIWGDTTQEDTKKYVAGAKDFDAALDNLYEDEEISKKISALYDNQEKVSSLMRKLKNPPEGYEDCYDAATALYQKYNSFIIMATSPTGSYNSYSEDFLKLDKETADEISKFIILLPD